MVKRRLLICAYMIIIIGLLMVYSSSNIWAQYKFNDAFYYIKRQALFAILGSVCMFVTSKIDYHLYDRYRFRILFLCFVLLVAVLIPGIGSVRGGSRSWFALGPVSFQPSELFKIGMIMFASSYISRYYHYLKKLKYSFLLWGIMGLGFILIMLQPDFGTGVVMVCSVVVMLIVSPFPFKYFIYLGFLGVLGIMGLILSAPYRMERIVAYLDPFQDPLGSGFQMIQSLYAIGPGGLLGVGFNNSIQKHFYLPEPQTDFIFSIYCEEFGLIGCIFLVSLYFYLIFLSLKISKESKDLYGSFLAIGLASMLGIQTIINLGVVVGLLPVTGETCNLEMLVSTSYLGAFRGEFVSFLLFFYPIGCILRRFS